MRLVHYPSLTNGLSPQLENFVNKSDLVTSPDWRATSLMCHSEGCDLTLNIVQKNLQGYADVVRVRRLWRRGFHNSMTNLWPHKLYRQTHGQTNRWTDRQIDG